MKSLNGSGKKKKKKQILDVSLFVFHTITSIKDFWQHLVHNCKKTYLWQYFIMMIFFYLCIIKKTHYKKNKRKKIQIVKAKIKWYKTYIFVNSNWFSLFFFFSIFLPLLRFSVFFVCFFFFKLMRGVLVFILSLLSYSYKSLVARDVIFPILGLFYVI